jgi:hypothetical protein
MEDPFRWPTDVDGHAQLSTATSLGSRLWGSSFFALVRLILMASHRLVCGLLMPRASGQTQPLLALISLTCNSLSTASNRTSLVEYRGSMAICKFASCRYIASALWSRKLACLTSCLSRTIPSTMYTSCMSRRVSRSTR